MQEILHFISYIMKCRKLMDLKVDVERAYDRMSWSFVEQVWTKFGCHHMFVGWFMGCVRVPTFTILINCSLKEWFSSTHRVCVRVAFYLCI